MSIGISESLVLITSSLPKEHRDFGTGFVVAHAEEGSTYVVTCAHVVQDMGGVGSLMAGGFPVREVVASGEDKGLDLAVLEVEGLRDKPALRLAASVEKDQEFVVVGFSEYSRKQVLRKIHGKLVDTMHFASSDGRNFFSAWELEIEGKHLLKKGYSGSPVIDVNSRRVLGVVSHLDTQGKKGSAVSIDQMERIWPLAQDLLLEATPAHILSREALREDDSTPQGFQPIKRLKFPCVKSHPKFIVGFPLVTSIVITFGVSIIRFLGVLEPFEMKIFDYLLRSRPPEVQLGNPDNRIVVIEATEADLAAQNDRGETGLGAISDAALKDVLEKLAKYQARIIALDLYRDFKDDPLSTYFQQNKDLFLICSAPDLENSLGVKPPAPQIVPLERVGFSNFILDKDGVLRRSLLEMPTVPGHPCQTRHSLAFLVALRYLELETGKAIDPNKIWLDEDRFQLGKTLFQRINSYEYSGYQDLDASGVQLLLNYRDPNQNLTDVSPHFSIEQVRNGEVVDTAFKDKIVLIGVTARTEAVDYVQTPYGEEIAGITIHAHIISQILSAALDGRALLWVLPQWGEFLWIGVWSLTGSFLAFYVKKKFWLSLLGVGGLATIYLTCLIAMMAQSFWLPMLPSIMSFGMAGSVVILYANRQSKHQAEGLGSYL